MDGSNSTQNNSNAKQPTPGKPGLSWTQPATSSTNAVQPKPVTKTAADESGDSTGRVIGIIVGIIIVFALVAWGIVAYNKRSAAPQTATTATSTATTSDTDTTAPATDTSADENPVVAPVATPTPTPEPVVTTAPVQTAPASVTLTVPSPQDAGSTVAFDGLSTTEPTWVVVYESADGTTPGNILGAGLFFKGDTSGSVTLLRPTTSGKTYLVSAATDNGDRVFAKADEKFVQDTTGAQMWIKFQTK